MDPITKMASQAGYITSSFGIVAQQIPAVPDDFKSWPVTAILGLIALAAMMLNAMTHRLHAKSCADQAAAQKDTAVELGKVTEQLGTTNKLMAEMCQKQGEANTNAATLTAEFRARPCMVQKP